MRILLACNALVNIILSLLLPLAAGFRVPSVQPRHDTLIATASGSSDRQKSPARRAFLTLPIQVVVLSPLSVVAAPLGEKVVKISEEEAEAKFREGYKSITYLLEHYDEICAGGGDNVRRYLGTVVSTKDPSGLVGINKVMKALEERADDFIEYTEMSNEVIKSISQADGSAYMSIFVTSSTSYTPPQKYFDDAKIEVKRCVKAMNELAPLVGIKL